MLRPIVILEHHFDKTARDFITKNISFLKELGYKKFLLEMNKEVKLEDFLAQSEFGASNLLFPLHIRNACSSLALMITEIKNAGMTIEFIDPQSQPEAHRLNINFSMAKSEYEKEKALLELESAKKTRDQVMSKKIVFESNEYEGGVISFCGFTHVDLLQNINHLTSLSAMNPCYLILSNFDTFLNEGLLDDAIWKQIVDPVYRNQFYKTNVHAVENPMSVSFAWLESSLSLSEKMEISDCYIGELLSTALDAKFNCEFDKFKVLSGSASFANKKDLEEAVNSIKQKFPGLHFQSFQTPPSRKVVGMNLPENTEILSNGFKKIKFAQN